MWLVLGTIMLFLFIGFYDGPVLEDGPPRDSYQPIVILP